VSDIYGKLTEHPDLPLTDAGRFTVQIKVHDFEPDRNRRDLAYSKNFCGRCGFNRVSPVHPQERA